MGSLLCGNSCFVVVVVVVIVAPLVGGKVSVGSEIAAMLDIVFFRV